MKKIIFTVCLSLLCTLSLAEFKEGQVDYLIKSPEGNGTLMLKISPLASLANINLSIAQMGMNMTLEFLIPHSSKKTGEKMYHINRVARSFSEVNMDDVDDDVKSVEPNNKPKTILEIKLLGTETMLGYETQHLLITQADRTSEIWLAKAIKLKSVMKKVQALGNNGRGQFNFLSELEKEGYTGFPLKMTTNYQNQAVEMTAVKIEAKPFAKDVFALPQGFQKTQTLTPVMNMPNGQNLNALKELIEKNMTPEQIEELKKMMQSPKK